MEDLSWRQLIEIQSSAVRSNSTDSSSNDGGYTSELVKNVVVIILSGIAIIVCMVLFTYGIAIIVDKYCCCCYPVSVDATGDDFDDGPVARKAGLWGLRASERMQILHYIFEKTTFTYNDKENDGRQDEMAMREFVCEGSSSETTDHQSDDPRDAEYEESGIEEKTDAYNHEEMSTTIDDEVDHEQVCCICLSAYENGCNLMAGTRCNHIFHYDCCMEWLEKHDHCPYCRNEMMLPSEMREAAIQVLGLARVGDMGQGQHVEEAAWSFVRPSEDLETGMSLAQTRPDSSRDSQ